MNLDHKEQLQSCLGSSHHSQFSIKKLETMTARIYEPPPDNVVDVRWSWNLTTEMVQALPLYYKLLPERSVSLKGIPLSVIAQRISAFMRKNSIACNYHGTAHVECITMDLVRFMVSLWKKRSGGEIVYLEIGNIQGSNNKMKSIQKALFYCVTTGNILMEGGMESRSYSPTLREIQTMNNEALCETLSPNVEKEAAEAMLASLELLKRDSPSDAFVGLESLAVITNPMVVERACADYVSRCFVFCDDETSFQLRKSIMDYFSNTERTADVIQSEGADNGDDSEMQYIRGQEFGDLHNLSLQVINHILGVAVCLRQSSPDLALPDRSLLFWDTVKESLLYNITVASHRPNEAALSTRCLQLLADIEIPLEDDSLPMLLNVAHSYGKNHHYKLEIETKAFMDRLAGTMEPNSVPSATI